MTYRCHIVDGPLDGNRLATPDPIQKLVVQTDAGTIYRYECDREMADDEGDYQSLVLTNDKEEFDAELKHDEAGHGKA